MKTNQTEAPQPPSSSGTGSLATFLDAFPHSVGLAITYSLCAWLAYNLYETLQAMTAYYVALPVGDYWRVASFLKDYQALHLGVFWKQHNEHRILFPEIIFAIDMLAAHGRMILPIAFSFLCYALTWAVLSITVLGDRETSRFDRCWAVLLAGVVTFWQGSALALAQPFLLQWPLMQVTVGLAIFFLKKTADTARTSYLVAAISAAVVATYSSANALMLWPLLLAIGLLIRVAKRFLVVLAMAAVVSVGVYFIGYHFSSQTNVRALLAHPFYFVGFVGSYLSMPFGGTKSAAFFVSLGLANLALVILLMALAWRFRLFSTSPAVVLCGYYLFTLMTILITSAGRMDPADPNFVAARVTRYLTVPFLNWAAVFLLSLWMSARLQWRILTTRRLLLGFSLLLLIGTYKLRSWQVINGAELANYQFAVLSLDSGLTDAEIIARIFPSPEFVDLYLPALKKNRIGIFCREHDKWFGQDLASFGAMQKAKIPGVITYTYPVEHGLEVVGWVNSDDARDPFPRIFLANERGQVVGFGRRPAAGFPADLRSLKTPEQESWVAFVNLAIPSRSVSAYAATRHVLAAIEGVATVPAFDAAAADDAGAPVENIVWHMDKTWALNGIPVLPVYGWLPSSAAYSSWHEHDENTGQIVAEFATPANGCVVLPVLHGPSIGGVSAQLVDADSGTVLADLPFRDRDALWSLWRVPLNSGMKRLRFVATDNGRDWGQWLAVSTPMSCR